MDIPDILTSHANLHMFNSLLCSVSRFKTECPWITTFQNDQNKFNDRFIEAFEDALSLVLSDPNAICLVTTGHHKFYSTGLDLQWISDQQVTQPTFMEEFTQRFYSLLARILVFPLPSIAAISGHAIGAGAFFSLVHDFRIMRRHRGSFGIPLARVHFPLTESLRSILKAKVADPRVLRDLVLFSRRLTPVEALDAGIVDQVLGHTANLQDRVVYSSSPIADSLLQISEGGSQESSKSSIAPQYGSGIQSTLPEQTSIPSQNFAENEEIVQASILLFHQIPADLRDRQVLMSLKECIFAEPLMVLRKKKVLNPMRPELGFVQRVYASEIGQNASAATMGASSIPENIVASPSKPVSSNSIQTPASYLSTPSTHASTGTISNLEITQITNCNNECNNHELSQEECSRLKPARLYSSSHL